MATKKRKRIIRNLFVVDWGFYNSDSAFNFPIRRMDLYKPKLKNRIIKLEPLDNKIKLDYNNNIINLKEKNDNTRKI
jgi:hypothetical protein